MGQLRVQAVRHGGGGRSYTIFDSMSGVHAAAERYLSAYAGRGTDRTYAYLLLDHLRWLEYEGLSPKTVGFRDLELAPYLRDQAKALEKVSSLLSQHSVVVQILEPDAHNRLALLLAAKCGALDWLISATTDYVVPLDPSMGEVARHSRPSTSTSPTPSAWPDSRPQLDQARRDLASKERTWEQKRPSSGVRLPDA